MRVTVRDRLGVRLRCRLEVRDRNGLGVRVRVRDRLRVRVRVRDPRELRTIGLMLGVFTVHTRHPALAHPGLTPTDRIVSF